MLRILSLKFAGFLHRDRGNLLRSLCFFESKICYYFSQTFFERKKRPFAVLAPRSIVVRSRYYYHRLTRIYFRGVHEYLGACNVTLFVAVIITEVLLFWCVRSCQPFQFKSNVFEQGLEPDYMKLLTLLHSDGWLLRK